LKKIIQIEPTLGEEEKKELQKVIDSGWYTEATKTREFEKKFAKFVGIKYASVVTSGTAALYIALKALGIRVKDEVIVPDLTFVASPNAIEMTGAKPVLIDIKSNSLNLDVSMLENLITKKTKAIMPVDFNGRKIEINKIRKFARKKNLYLIEDACHAIGSYYNNQHMGTLCDVGVFSFSTPKIITTGQGGMVVTNNKEIYEKCVAMKDFGRDIRTKKDMRKAFEHKTIGYNFKFTEFQAAVGIAQMRKLNERIKRKRNMYKMYMELLQSINEIEFIKTDPNKETLWMIDILLKTKHLKNKLINFLEKRKIEVRTFYPPIHRLKPYRKIDSKYQVTADISDRGLWLPSSVSLSNEQIKRVCTEINNFFR